MTPAERTSDFFTPAILEAPFAFYDAVRGETPVLEVRQPGHGRDIYLVTAFGLVQDILRDADLFSSDFYAILSGGAKPNAEAAAIYAQGWPEIDVMLTSDPPRHSRYRSLAAAAFTPVRINAMEGHLRSAIDLLIDRMAETNEIDFIDRFAVPLTVSMVVDTLGIDRSMVETVREWTDAYILRNGQMASATEEVVAARKIVACQTFLYAEIQSRRARPRADMISDLVGARLPDGGALDDVEILSMLQLILVAGNETTRNAMTALLAHLLDRDGEAWRKLLAQPGLVRNAVEEALRLEPPASTTWRVARRDAIVGGVDIPAGSVLMCRIDAVNRDPSIFAEADRMDIERTNANRHLSFGNGIHFCIGHVLARRELNLALSRLIERVPSLRIVPERSDLRIHTSVHVRGMRALRVGYDAVLDGRGGEAA